MQIIAWAIALVFGDTYAGLIAAIILVDIALQYQDLEAKMKNLDQISVSLDSYTEVSRIQKWMLVVAFVGARCSMRKVILNILSLRLCKSCKRFFAAPP